MKNQIFIMALLCLVVTRSQGQNNGNSTKQNYTLIFMDQTMSTPISKVKNGYEAKLMQYMEENIVQPNDKVVVCNIYEQTLNFSNRETFTFKVPPLKLEGLNEIQRMVTKNRYENQLRLFKSTFIKKVLNTVFHSVKPDGKSTDIVSTLAIINEFSQNQSLNVKAVYISDLIETKFRNLNAGNRFVSDTRTANQVAQEDYKKIQNLYGLPTSFLANVEVTAIVPKIEGELQRKVELTYAPVYWNRIWTLFGASQPNYL